MKRYFDSIAEAVERKRRTCGASVEPSATERMAAIRRRIADRASNVGQGTGADHGTAQHSCVDGWSSRPPIRTGGGGRAAEDVRQPSDGSVIDSLAPACSTACSEAASSVAYHSNGDTREQRGTIVRSERVPPEGATEGWRLRRDLVNRLRTSGNRPERAA